MLEACRICNSSSLSEIWWQVSLRVHKQIWLTVAWVMLDCSSTQKLRKVSKDLLSHRCHSYVSTDLTFKDKRDSRAPLTVDHSPTVRFESFLIDSAALGFDGHAGSPNAYSEYVRWITNEVDRRIYTKLKPRKDQINAMVHRYSLTYSALR